MVRVGLIGLGKMGISHLAIIKAHPEVELAAICDSTRYALDVLNKYTGIKCHTDYREMIDEERLDCVFVATPSKAHAAMVKYALEHNLHVFCEKPFVLDPTAGLELIEIAKLDAFKRRQLAAEHHMQELAWGVGVGCAHGTSPLRGGAREWADAYLQGVTARVRLVQPCGLTARRRWGWQVR